MGYDLYSKAVELSDAESKEIVERVFAEFSNGSSHPMEIMDATWRAWEATGGYYRFGLVAWPKLLELARDHGWQPEHPEELYVRQSSPEISAEDAANLAAALESAVETLGDVTPFQSALQTTPMGDGGVMYSNRSDLSPEAFWSCDPDKVRRFIVFARQGAFTIT